MPSGTYLVDEKVGETDALLYESVALLMDDKDFRHNVLLVLACTFHSRLLERPWAQGFTPVPPALEFI